MRMDTKEARCLVEEREETIMELDGSAKIQRKGWFIRPTEYILDRNLGVPFFPILHSPCSDWLTKLVCKVSLKGWPNPQPNWKQWVEKLKPIHGDIWKKAGIFYAIEVSTCKIRRDLTAIWGILPFWSCETNTFIFPFGEASITLEDTMILGGFSPIGICVRGVEPLSEELKEFNLHLVREHKAFNKTSTKKACFSAWMNHFMKCNNSSIEHIAFLSLWLSRYVFPKAPIDVVHKEMFPIAILLAHGERFALGPAVLASLYRDMRLLKEYLTCSGKGDALLIFAPFQIIQMWVWEHFDSVWQTDCPKFIDHNKPRVTRWHNLAINRIPYTNLVGVSTANFQWRPYVEKIDDWISPTYYKENSKWISGDDVNDDWTISFAQCLRACELVGLDSIQLYLPQRVSQQFGYDQDIIGCAHVDVRVSDWELAWANYKKDEINYVMYVLPQHFKSGVTYQYYTWWNENSSNSLCIEIGAAMQEKFMEMKRKKISIDFKMKKQKLQLDLTTTRLEVNDVLLELDQLTRYNVRIIKGIARMRGTSSSAALAENQLTHFANNVVNLASVGEEEKRQDGHHRFENMEFTALDYGTSCSDSEELSENEHEE